MAHPSKSHKPLEPGEAGRLLDRLFLLEQLIPAHELQQVLRDTGCIDASIHANASSPLKSPAGLSSPWASSPSCPSGKFSNMPDACEPMSKLPVARLCVPHANAWE